MNTPALKVRIAHAGAATMFDTPAQAFAALAAAPAGREYELVAWKGQTWVRVSARRGAPGALVVR